MDLTRISASSIRAEQQDTAFDKPVCINGDAFKASSIQNSSDKNSCTCFSSLFSAIRACFVALYHYFQFLFCCKEYVEENFSPLTKAFHEAREPVKYQARKMHLDQAKALIQQGADVNAIFCDRHPLLIAVIEGIDSTAWREFTPFFITCFKNPPRSLLSVFLRFAHETPNGGHASYFIATAILLMEQGVPHDEIKLGDRPLLEAVQALQHPLWRALCNYLEQGVFDQAIIDEALERMAFDKDEAVESTQDIQSLLPCIRNH